MKEGFGLIRSDARARRAFELANEAVLMQQLEVPVAREAYHGKEPIRDIRIDC